VTGVIAGKGGTGGAGTKSATAVISNEPFLEKLVPTRFQFVEIVSVMSYIIVVNGVFAKVKPGITVKDAAGGNTITTG
jgi:hypothetical protein